MKCCICGKEIEIEPTGWAEGHNALPVKDGRCCSDCNYKIVIPARLDQMKPEELKRFLLSQQLVIK